MASKKKAKASSNTMNSKVAKSTAKTTNAQLKAIAEKQTKMEILKAIAEQTGLALKEIQAVFQSAAYLVKCHLITKGSGEFAIPEMAIKVVRKTKPATKERQGRNPVTGENITIPAKPKREVIKIRPLKSLKEILLNS